MVSQSSPEVKGVSAVVLSRQDDVYNVDEDAIDRPVCQPSQMQLKRFA